MENNAGISDFLYSMRIGPVDQLFVIMGGEKAEANITSLSRIISTETSIFPRVYRQLKKSANETLELEVSCTIFNIQEISPFFK